MRETGAVLLGSMWNNCAFCNTIWCCWPGSTEKLLGTDTWEKDSKFILNFIEFIYLSFIYSFYVIKNSVEFIRNAEHLYQPWKTSHLSNSVQRNPLSHQKPRDRGGELKANKIFASTWCHLTSIKRCKDMIIINTLLVLLGKLSVLLFQCLAKDNETFSFWGTENRIADPWVGRRLLYHHAAIKSRSEIFWWGVTLYF